MYKKVKPWVDMVELDHKILAFWKKNRSFEKLRAIIKGRPPWSFLDGPITANNPMGVHHAWGRSLKDAFQRYWAMNRRDLRYQNGFDCQGLWVEVEVEKELGFKTKKDIEAYGIDEFVNKCRERVQKFSEIQTQQSIRLGYWMDWENSYYTMSDENNYTIWGFLNKCHDRGFIYKGHDVMPWCPRCGTGISQHEMHEGYKEVVHESVFLRFPVRHGSKEALLVWTTTPWTLSSNVAAAVHPDVDYVKVKQGDWIYYLAEALAKDVLEKQGSYNVLEKLKGKDLTGITYEGPFDELPAQQKTGLRHPVIPWDDVSDAEGTGIVHIAPGCGKEDFQLGIEFDLDVISPIDEAGVFVEGFNELTGKQAADIAPLLFVDLEKKDLLYNIAPCNHAYPHCWRCNEPLLFRQVEEWFIAMDEWRNAIMANVKQVKWIPSFGFDLEMDWLKNMQDWMISKKRYWGLALPIWECDACNHFHVIGSKEELKEKAVAGWDEFEGHSPHRPWIDAVRIPCDKCGNTATRVPDVGNPWLDAGIVTYSTLNYNKDRKYWEKWIPADLVLECFPGQFRNWFYSLLAMSTMMENIPPFKTLVGHALVNDEHGEEMHKSRGNAILFEEAADKMGCDVMRWIFFRQDMSHNLNFGYTIAKEIRGRFFNTLWNTYGFFVNYARLANWTPPNKATPVKERPDFDRWILSDLQLLIEHSHQAYQKYDLKRLVIAAEDFMETFSNGYIRHNRNRFWKVGNVKDSTMAFETLYDCLLAFIRIIAPMTPFMTEEIYQNLVRSHDSTAPESIHHTEFPKADKSIIDKGLSEEMDAVTRIIRLCHSARERAGIKIRQPLSILTISGSTRLEKKVAERFTHILMTFLNVKKLEILEPGTPKPAIPAIYTAKPKFKAIARKIGEKTQALKIYSIEYRDELTEYVQTGKVFRVILDGDPVTLDPDDFVMEERQADKIAFAEEKGLWVSFDTNIDEELKIEGLMRDLLRHLQVLRKQAGLEIEDRITLTWQSKEPLIGDIFHRWEDFLNAELLCIQMKEGDIECNGIDIQLGDVRVKVLIKNAGSQTFDRDKSADTH
ncbi:MAG: isoleucine--tRNA ligase [Desulfobacteraceae bacterium]|nr:isoleucine--tRNA ligase [Desulfobacteraceae bacterium]